MNAQVLIVKLMIENTEDIPAAAVVKIIQTLIEKKLELEPYGIKLMMMEITK